MAFSILLALFTVLAGNPPMAERSSVDANTCQLIVDGKCVEKLVLREKNGPECGPNVIGSSLFFKPGQYRVRQIVLKGGYTHDAFADTDWFTLSPGKPYHLRAGVPLTSHVEVTREGRLLKLDYRLVDVAGRQYRDANRTSPPRFAIYQNGREIASGSFEYG